MMTDNYKKFMACALLPALLLISACEKAENSGSADNNAVSEEFDDASMSEAEKTIAITDMKHSGKNISFTIPKDARKQSGEAEDVSISGLYAQGEGKDTECPYIKASQVEQETDDYEATSGKAAVTATFETEEMAKAAYDSKCVVIENDE